MKCIPREHSMRGEAHARAADLFTRKINNLAKKEKVGDGVGIGQVYLGMLREVMRVKDKPRACYRMKSVK